MSRPQNKIDIYVVKIPDQPVLPQLVERLGVLDAEEQEQYGRYRVDFKKVEFLVGRLMLKGLIGQHLGRRPEEITFVKNHYGKLYLPDALRPAEPLHFNLTHSGKRIVVAVTTYSEIGVDVEETTKDHLNLMPSVYQEMEIDFVNAQPDMAGKHDAFYMLWTRKEAHMKAVGMGMSLPPNSFHVPLERERAVRDPWEYRTFRTDPEYMISTALQKRAEDELDYELHEITIEGLRSF